MVKANDDPLELVASRYEEWYDRFAAESDRVCDVLAARTLNTQIERIEHVGSTAVPGLEAKDIVDLDIVVADDAVRDISRTLEADLGGDRVSNSDQWHPVFRVEGGQRFNDHVFAVSSDGWKTSVITRDVLRTYPDLRTKYEQLKRELAAEHDDLFSYSEGKTAFIERVLDVARMDEQLTFDFAMPTT